MFFSAVGNTDKSIEVWAIGFHGDFMCDQLPTMVQVTEAAFKNIEMKSPSLLTRSQSTDTIFLTDQTLLHLNGSWGNDMVPTLFPLPGA